MIHSTVIKQTQLHKKKANFHLYQAVTEIKKQIFRTNNISK